MNRRRASTRRSQSFQDDALPMEEEEIMDMLGYFDDGMDVRARLPGEEGASVRREFISPCINQVEDLAPDSTGDLVNGESVLLESRASFPSSSDDDDVQRRGHLAATDATQETTNVSNRKLSPGQVITETSGAKRQEVSAFGTPTGIPGAHTISGGPSSADGDGDQECTLGPSISKMPSAVDDLESSLVIEYLMKLGMPDAARELAEKVDVSGGDVFEALNDDTSAEQTNTEATDTPPTQPGAQHVVIPLFGVGFRRGARRQSANQAVTAAEETAPTVNRRGLPRRRTTGDIPNANSGPSVGCRSLPVILGLTTILSDDSNNPDGNEDPVDTEVGIPLAPPELAYTTTVGSVENPVRATAVDDIMTVEATQVDPVEVLKANQKQHFRLTAFGCMILVTVIVVIILSVTLTSKNYVAETIAPSSSPTANPTLPADRRWDVLREVLAPVSGNAFLYSVGSAEYRALSWMVNDYEGTDPEDDPEKVVQRYIMALLYYQTKGSNWTNRFNFLTPLSECRWTGVAQACDDDGFLTVLDLHENNLQGRLPTAITHLRRLEQLQLHLNTLTGTLPSKIANMTRLRYLDLIENSMNGTIPTGLYGLTSLEYFSIFRNAFHGTINSAIGQLSDLTYLHVGANLLTGSLPEELYDITGMLELQIQQNSFTGTLSERIADMTNLTSVAFFANFCNGTLPTIFGALRQLTNMQVSDMALTGTMPSELGTLTKLSRLALSYNLFTGTLPREYKNLTSLEKLYLQNNDFFDDISFLCDEEQPLIPFRVDLHEVNCTCCTCCNV